LQPPAAFLPRTLGLGVKALIPKSCNRKEPSMKQQVASGANAPALSHRSWSAPAPEPCFLALSTAASGAPEPATGAGALQHQRPFEIHVGIASVTLHVLFPRLNQAIHAQAVGFLIDAVKKARSHQQQLHVVYRAFEHRLLHSLSKSDANLGHLAEAPPASRVLSSHVVTDQ